MENGIRVPIKELNKSLEARENAEVLFLWCHVCATNIGIFNSLTATTDSIVNTGNTHIMSDKHRNKERLQVQL